LRHELFDTDTVRDLGHALHDSNDDVRRNSMDFFIDAIAHGRSFHFHGKSILIFVEDFRDRIFDTEIIAALGRALKDESSDVRSSVVKIFTVAMAQGALHCF
jgi:hypothetical protein